MKKRLLTRAAFVFAALIASHAAHAAGPIVASGSATLSNIQLTFSDFRPDDGIAAGVSWAQSGSGWLQVDCCDDWTNQSRRLDIQGDRLNNRVQNGLSLPDNIAYAERTTDGARVGFSVDADHIGAIYDSGKDAEFYSTLRAQGSVFISGHELLLKPGTEIQISGQASLEATLNLLNTNKYGMPGSRGVSALVLGEALLHVQRGLGSNDVDFLLAPQGSDAFASGSLNQIKSAGQITGGDTTLNISRSFNYVIRNNGTTDQTVIFGLRSNISFLGEHAGIASSVPEPETFALLMAGLVSLVWARGRQHRSKLARCAAATCLVATLLPLGAQAAPLVSVEGVIQSDDVLGKTQGGFAVDDESGPFAYKTTGSQLIINVSPGLMPYPYAVGELFTSASNGPNGFAVGIGTYMPDPSEESYFPEPMIVSASARLDWSDTIVNTNAQESGVFIDFAMPRFSWALSDAAHFKASIWIEGQSSPVWFTGMDRGFDTGLGRPVTVFSGKDIGLRGDDGVGSLALSRQVYLGPLGAADSFKVHFTVEMSASGRGVDMSFASTAPSLSLLTSPVPEPGSVALVMVGLGLIGWSARRRQVATPLARGQHA